MHKGVGHPEQRWAVPATADHVARVRREVAAFAVAAGMGAGAVSGVRLAVSEAMTNAVVHAYRNGASGEIRVCACVDDAGCMLVIVEDDVPGVQPRSDSPGLGLGLPTIAALASRLEVATSSSGACLRMAFHPAS